LGCEIWAHKLLDSSVGPVQRGALGRVHSFKSDQCRCAYHAFVVQLLDDQMVKTQAMRASPYIGPFEERVKTWEAKLNRTQVHAM
jgi:hypothetical protein